MPQNFYCIQVDKKAEESIIVMVMDIVSCLKNILWLASEWNNIVYSSWNQVKADLNYTELLQM